MTAGRLSLEQAPPLSVPLRFFLTAPFFGMATGIALAITGGHALSSRWLGATLGMAHAFALGVIVMVILGALQQMLPVVAGTPLARASGLSAIVHVGWTLGAASLAIGLGWEHERFIAAGGLLLLTAGFTFAVECGRALAGSSSRLESVSAMRWALRAFWLTLALGGVLAAGHVGAVSLWRPAGTNAHAALGLLGWVTLLIIGISWQVVPMFQVTPMYPASLRRWGVPMLFTLLLVRVLVALVAASAGLGGSAARVVLGAMDVAIAAALVTFVVATLRVQAARRRRVADATLQSFQLGMLSLIIAIAAHLGVLFGAPRVEVLELIAGLALLVGFASFVVVGMLMKIVAFLGWFHLQAVSARRVGAGLAAGDVPTMKDLVPDTWSRWQVRVHSLACALIIASPLAPTVLALPAGVALAASFGLLLVILLRVTWRCRGVGIA